MAVTGKFVADFSDFQTAAATAETKLVSFEAGANKVVASIERMENSLSGRKLIQDATLAAQAVENIGGVTALTDAELARLGDTAAEAIEKMNRMGIEVPPGLKEIAAAAAEAKTGVEGLGDAADKGAPKATGLANAAKQFDGVLAAMGINIGPVIRGIEEIGTASGKSIGELGKLQTAGLALGAGLAGWGIGRAISGFFDLDKKIGDATAKLLGWGDVAGQEAAAGAETLARASANAGRRITDMAEAIRINEAAVVSLKNTVKPAAFDIQAMREQMLKTEAARVIGPDVTPSVVALGRATVDTTNKLSALEAKLNSVDRLNASINSRLQSLSDDLDRQQRERDARRQGDNTASVTRQIVGNITPLSERDASNTTKLQAMIAELARTVAEFRQPSFDAGAGPRASDLVLQAAQRNADNVRQLEYLRQLLASAPTGSTAPLLSSTTVGPAFGQNVVLNSNVSVSGVIDESAKRQLADMVGVEIMRVLRSSRMLGTT